MLSHNCNLIFKQNQNWCWSWSRFGPENTRWLESLLYQSLPKYSMKNCEMLFKKNVGGHIVQWFGHLKTNLSSYSALTVFIINLQLLSRQANFPHQINSWGFGIWTEQKRHSNLKLIASLVLTCLVTGSTEFYWLQQYRA